MKTIYNMLNIWIKNSKKILIVDTLIVSFFVLLFSSILKRPFLLANDQLYQYNIFYREWLKLIEDFFNNGIWPFYSWNMYLGSDFYSAMGYYCTGDIFLPFLFLFKNNLELGLIIETIICFYISTLSFNHLLLKLKTKNEDARLLITIAYGLGGMVSLYFGNYMFHRFYAFLPFLLIGTIVYFDNKKPFIFILSVCVLFLQNYYFMFPSLLFLFMYCLTYEIKKQNKLQQILKDFFSFLFFIFVGFSLSAIITLPSMMYLLNNSRIGAMSYNGIFWPFKSYIAIFMTLISLNPVDTGLSLFQGYGQAHEYSFSLFITIIPLIASVNYLAKKENRADACLMFLLIILFSIKPLSSIMHGFSNPSFRWLFLVQLYILMTAGQGIDELDLINNKKFIFIYLTTYVVFLIYLIVASKWQKVNHIIILFISLFFAFLIISLYKNNKKIGIYLSIFELVFFQSYYFCLESKGFHYFPDSICKEEIIYNQQKDIDPVYRYYYSYVNNNPNSVLNQNKSLDYGFMSTSGYNSLSDSNIDLFNRLANTSHDLDWVLYSDNPYVNNMLGVKYYIVYKEDNLPKELEFKYAYNLDYLLVYENLNYKGFGYTANKLKYTKDFNNIKDFNDYIMIDNDDIDLAKYQNIDEVKLNINERLGNYLKADIYLDSDNILLIPIPNNPGWKIRINGDIVKPISLNGGFIGLELCSGNNVIEMNFISPYFKVGGLLSIFGTISFIIIYLKKEFVFKTKL